MRAHSHQLLPGSTRRATRSQLTMSTARDAFSVTTPTTNSSFHTIRIVLSQTNTKQRCARTTPRWATAPTTKNANSHMASTIWRWHLLSSISLLGYPLATEDARTSGIQGNAPMAFDASSLTTRLSPRPFAISKFSPLCAKILNSNR